MDANNDNVGGNPDSPIEIASKGRKRPKRFLSDVWKNFKIIESSGNGEERCECLKCHQILSCGTQGGTSHLKRHVDKYCIHSKSKTTGQQLLHFSTLEKATTSLGNWKFDQDRSREDLTRLFIKHELPFRLLEKDSFKVFVTNLQPMFKHVSRFTLKRDCIKMYDTEKVKLKDEIKKSSHRICITTDLWTSIQTIGYIAITGHYIDEHWTLKKKILSFCVLPSPHTGDNISDMIIHQLSEWGIENLCTITVDNASANDVAVSNLIEHFAPKSSLILYGKVFHVRCWAHILNLVVQDGLIEIKDIVAKIRNLVKYVKCSQRRKEEFEEVAKQERVSTSKELVLDVSTRWNSTFLMLQSALNNMKVFIRMKSRDPYLFDTPSIAEWKKADNICKALEVFYTATKVFSGHRYSTSNLFFNQIFEVKRELNSLLASDDFSIRNMAAKMSVKFEKYWKERGCNLPLVIAVALDPRYKFEYIRFCLSKVYSDSEVDDFMNEVETSMYKIYEEYSMQFQSTMAAESRQSQLPTVVNDNIGGSATGKRREDFNAEFRKKKKEMVGLEIGKSEIDMYLVDSSADFNDEENDSFDILHWWKSNSSKYRILSRLARDFLAIPMSTVASESAFSTGGRVLDAYRSRLEPSTVEALICVQDWLCGPETSNEEANGNEYLVLTDVHPDE